MKRKRRSREFWVKVIATIESGEASVDQIAHRYGLYKKTIVWWRTKLRGDARRGKIDLVPVRVANVVQASMRVILGDVIVEIVDGSLEDVATLVRALRS
jgi:transposase-like protein